MTDATAATNLPTDMDFVGVGSGVDAAARGDTGLAAGRRDGRGFSDMRSLSLEQGSMHTADGSATVTCGNTCVLSSVYGPTECAIARQDATRCTVSVTIRDRQTESSSDSLRDLVRSIMLTSLHPRKVLHISVHILSSDGGVISACINASVLALLDAGVPLLSIPVSSCVALSNTFIIADPNDLEESEADSVLTLTYSTKNGELCDNFASIHTTGDVGGQGEFTKASQVAHSLAEHTLGFFKLSIARKRKEPRAY